MPIILPADCRDPEEREQIVQLIDTTCAKVGQAWRKAEAYRGAPSKKMVLVDLTVDVWDGVLTRLIIGKYVSWHHNARLCALVPSSAAIPHFTQKMCLAFGCDIVLGLGEAFNRTLEQTPNYQEEVRDLLRDWPREGPELRDRVAGLRFHGLPVGDLIYDSYLRGNGCVTIERLDAALVSTIADGLIRHHMYRSILDSHEVVAVIAAHVVYNYFGMLTRLAVSRNITVTQDLGLSPLRLKKLGHFSEARLPLDHFAPREFESVWRHERREALEFANAYMERRTGGLQDLGYKDAVFGAYGGTRHRYDRGELCERLGWDPSKPIVCIMSHVFFESPHSVPDTLYHDVHCWLEETLAIAARNPHIQWLLKPHPDHKYFDENLRDSPLLVTGDQGIERLLAPHRDQTHIALCPADLNTASVMRFAKAIVTKYSSAGYEFASQGVPVVVASRAPYTRLGFTIEPRTPEEYARTLGELDRVEPLTQEQRERALTYIYLFLGKSRCSSSLLPPFNHNGFWAPTYDAGILNGILERVDGFEADQDPLNEAVQAMLRLDTTTLNMRLW